LQQGACGLFAAHDGDAGCWPGVDKTGVVGLAAHRIVTCTVGVADDDGDLGDDGIGDGVDHLGAILDDTGMFASRAYHEAGDILQKDEGDLFLVAVHDKTGGLIRAVVIDHAAHLHLPLFRFHDLSLVRDDAHRPAFDSGIAAEDGLAIILLELFEDGIIHEAVDDLDHIVGFGGVRGQQAVELFRGMTRRYRSRAVEDAFAWRVSQAGHYGPDLVKAFLLCFKLVVRDARDLSMRHCSTQRFGVDVLADGGFYQVGTGEEDGTGALDHEGLVAHNGEIGPSGYTRAHDGGYLGDAHSAHAGVV